MDVGHADEFDTGDRNYGHYFKAGWSTEVRYLCPSAHNDDLDDCIGPSIQHDGKMTPSHCLLCDWIDVMSFLTRATRRTLMATSCRLLHSFI